MGDGDETTNPERVYEFTRHVHSRLLVERGEMGSTAHRHILVLALLFAALSYGQTVLSRTQPGELSERLAFFWWSAVGVGVLAAFVLAYAFFVALKLLRIGKVYLPGTDFDTSREPDWISRAPREVLLDLTRATVKAIEWHTEEEMYRRTQAKRLNVCLAVGFPPAALFLVVASAVDLLAPKQCKHDKGSPVAMEKEYMGDEKDDQQDQQVDGESDSVSSEDDDSSSLNTEPQDVIRGKNDWNRESTERHDGERRKGQ